MNNQVFSLISVIVIGLGATLIFDLWALFLNHALKITSSNFCLVGRWLLYMREGTFTHSDITSVARKSAECMTGRIAHYMSGIAFAIVFVKFVGRAGCRAQR